MMDLTNEWDSGGSTDDSGGFGTDFSGQDTSSQIIGVGDPIATIDAPPLPTLIDDPTPTDSTIDVPLVVPGDTVTVTTAPPDEQIPTIDAPPLDTLIEDSPLVVPGDTVTVTTAPPDEQIATIDAPPLTDLIEAPDATPIFPPEDEDEDQEIFDVTKQYAQAWNAPPVPKAPPGPNPPTPTSGSFTAPTTAYSLPSASYTPTTSSGSWLWLLLIAAVSFGIYAEGN